MEGLKSLKIKYISPFFDLDKTNKQTIPPSYNNIYIIQIYTNQVAWKFELGIFEHKFFICWAFFPKNSGLVNKVLVKFINQGKKLKLNLTKSEKSCP